MVTAVETRERIEARPITLQELGEMIGVPIVVCPWWGSVRSRSVNVLFQVSADRIPDTIRETGRKTHLAWVCPAQGRNQKKRPEVQNGVIALWEGQCGYKGAGGSNDRHTHAQTIEVKSVAHQAMLIAIRLSEGSRSYFLLGMDSGRPFAVQVTKRPQTVKEAFDWLMPKMVREAIAGGLNVKRQGDWFFIPTNRDPRQYKYSNNAVSGSAPGLKVNTLYRGAPLIYNGAQTRHRGGLVIYKSVLGAPSAVPFVKGNVRAPDHPTLPLKNWHIGVRNRSHPWRNTGQRARVDD